MTIGYTQRQADRIKRQIDADVAAIEDRVGRMGRRVPDHAEGGFFCQPQLEGIREGAEYLKAVVDRRTQR